MKVLRLLACAVLMAAGVSGAAEGSRPDETAIQLLHADESGVTFRVEFPAVEAAPLDESGSVLLSFTGSYPVGRAGEPQLPAASVALGAPHDAQIGVRASPGHIMEMSGLRPAPVPLVVNERPVYRENAEAYRSNEFLPARWAEVASDGLIRNRRVVQIEMRPLRVQASTGRARQCASMTVRVDFLRPPSASTSFSSGSAAPRVRPESPTFQRYFERHLLNEEASRVWRAPSAPGGGESGDSETRQFAVKMHVAEKGVCRITGAQLQALGVDLAAAHPSRLRIEWNGGELPAYVSGAQDGRFDPEDYVDFLATTPESHYSRYNVYWLISGERRGMRPAELEGAVQTSLAATAPAFRSKIKLEKNLLHTRLQESPPKAEPPEDPHTWYDNRNHWLWFGVQNGSIQNTENKAAREFPIYDPAKSLDFVRIDVALQGETPVEHEAVVMFNGLLIGRAQEGWFEQEPLQMGKTMRMEHLIDPVDGLNTLEITRVDDHGDNRCGEDRPENNVDLYPYHMYVDSVEIEYTRLYRAVSDSLFASSPPSSKKLAERELRTIQYDVADFLNPNIAVYEHDGLALTARLRNVESLSKPLDQEGRARLSAIQAAQGKTEPLPDRTYAARFQMRDNRDWDFIAVSDDGVVQPDRLELDIPSNLKDPANGADWIILYHSRYEESARRLRDWRATAKGGGHRAFMANINDIYDEFSHGAVSPWAIKAFLTHAYVHWSGAPVTHVVILGDGTYDLYGVDEELYPEAPEFLGYIPTHYVWSQYGETGIDHWYAAVSGIDALPDLFLGRIPVENIDEARAAVEKIVRYEERPPNGTWRRQIVSVADDETTYSGDFIFKKSLTEISQNHTLLGYVTNKVFLTDYLDKYGKNNKTQASNATRREIIDALNRGAVIAQYAGHGGRLVWAHEIIFDNIGIRRLSETDRLSLMFVLSCNNAYFDAPAEPSMGELLMRIENRGIVGMVAATRYTYGSGNDALAKIIFDDIFKRNVRGFGEIAFNPKAQLMLEQGLGHLDVMQQFLLFGDPATHLYMAKYEAHPILEERSVEPGGTLRIQPGSVLKSTYDPKKGEKTYAPVPSFNGRLFATAQFVDKESGLVIEKTAEADAVNGRYPALTLPVPLNAQKGRAQVELYIQSSSDLAVGGSGFAVSEPVIEEIDIAETDGNVVIALKVTDDGAVESVALEWQQYSEDGSEWLSAPMVPDAEKGAGWYRQSQTIPAPPAGKLFRYSAVVTDADGNRTDTETFAIAFHSVPDWNVAIDHETGEPKIRYGFDSERGWGFHLRVENKNEAAIETPVTIRLYLGNPDLDGDDAPDEDAKKVGEAVVQPSEWTRGNPLLEGADGEDRLRDPNTPLNLNWKAEAFAPYRLENGAHSIAVWIDPDGETEETKAARQRGNLSHRRIQANEIRPGASSVDLQTLDGSMTAALSRQTFGGAYTARLSAEEAALPAQASLTPLPWLNSEAAALTAIEADGFPAGGSLNEPAPIQLRFDLDAVRKAIAQANKEAASQKDDDEEKEEPDQDAALIRLLSSAGVYEWRPQLERWRRLRGSGFAKNAQRQPQTFAVLTEPTAPKFRADAKWVYDPASVERGRYFAFVVNSRTYDLYRLNLDSRTLERVLENQWARPVYEPLPDEADRRYPYLRNGLSGLRFGEVWEVNLTSARSGETGVADAYLGNSGGGVVRPSLTEGEIDEDAWTVMFISRREFEVRRRSQPNEPPRLGSLVDGWTSADGKLRIEALSGRRPFEPGDVAQFETRHVGALNAEAPRLGTFAAFYTNDESAPAISFAVEGQDFADGDAVSPTPAIALAVSDDSGVDPLDVSLALTRDGQPAPPIDASDLQVHFAPGSSKLLINYAPELEPGSYRLKASAADLDGNEASAEIRFNVSQSVELISVLNYPNPFRTETDIAVEAAGEMETLDIAVYSLHGRVVRRLRHPPSAGFVRVRWDGRDADGREVANGVYYAVVKMTARGETRSQTLKLLKLK